MDTLIYLERNVVRDIQVIWFSYLFILWEIITHLTYSNLSLVNNVSCHGTACMTSVGVVF